MTIKSYNKIQRNVRLSSLPKLHRLLKLRLKSEQLLALVDFLFLIKPLKRDFFITISGCIMYESISIKNYHNLA